MGPSCTINAPNTIRCKTRSADSLWVRPLRCRSTKFFSAKRSRHSDLSASSRSSPQERPPTPSRWRRGRVRSLSVGPLLTRGPEEPSKPGGALRNATWGADDPECKADDRPQSFTAQIKGTSSSHAPLGQQSGPARCRVRSLGRGILTFFGQPQRW